MKKATFFLLILLAFSGLRLETAFAQQQMTEAEIAKWQEELNKTKQGTKSLQGEAAILQAKINEAKAFIKQRQIQIQQLTAQIGEKNRTINTLEAKLNRGKESLAS